MRFTIRARWSAFVLPVTMGLLTPVAPAQATGNPSFGNILIPAKHVVLRRALPPAFNANGRAVAVVVEPGINGQVAGEVQSGLEGFLTSSSSGVRLQRDHPDILVECRPTAFTPPHVTNETTNGTQTSVLSGALELVYRITLPASGRILVSDRYLGDASSQLSQTIQGGPAKTKSVLGMKMQTGGPTTTKNSNETPQQMQSAIAQDAARYIAAYLVSTAQAVDIPLAMGGSLNEPDKLALAGLWSRDLEALEAAGSFPNPRADAFRVYDMGVANEALAYATQDLAAALKYLSEASNDYGKAFDAVPGEKQFIASQDRIKTALAQITALNSIAKTNAAQVAVAAKFHANAGPEKPTESPLTDADVVSLIGAHVDEANILDTIQHAGSVSFDLSIPAQVRLTHAGVSGRVLLAMKARARTAEAH